MAKLIGVVFSIAAGLIAGKEGPFVHGGGIVGGGIGSLGSQCVPSTLVLLLPTVHPNPLTLPPASGAHWGRRAICAYNGTTCGLHISLPVTLILPSTVPPFLLIMQHQRVVQIGACHLHIHFDLPWTGHSLLPPVNCLCCYFRPDASIRFLCIVIGTCESRLLHAGAFKLTDL